MDMDMGNNNIHSLLKYIQENYRHVLLKEDFKIINSINDNFSNSEIIKGIEYCLSRKTNSLKYLEKTLKNKYYETVEPLPSWLNETTVSEPLTEDDTEWANWSRDFYYKFCDTKEEAEKRIRENGLEV